MSWTTDNAVKRIFNSFKRLKNQIFEQDIEALKLLNEELINNQKNYVNDNILFAKLLNYALRNELKHQGSMKMAIKSIDSILKTPIAHHTEFLRLELNHKDFLDYVESLGIETDHLNHKENNNDLILTENQKEVQDKLLNFWNYDKVEKSFYNSANEFLKDLNNYQ
jgi:hypothetical protein